MPPWMVQGLATQIVWGLLVLAGGIVIAYLKRTASEWFAPAVYGLAASAIIAIGLYAFMRLISLPGRPTPQITAENVEQNIRAWLDEFSLSSRKLDEPAATFALLITLSNGDLIEVARPKGQYARYIVFRTTIVVDPKIGDMIKQLTPDQAFQLNEEVGSEMARMKISVDPLAVPLTTVGLTSRTPLTRDLTEDSFIEQLDLVEYSMTIARNTIRLKLANYGTTPPKPK